MSLSNNFPAIAPSLNLDFANTKRLDPRITFTRTTTATYYDGVTTAKAEENLLLQSQDFTTTWINSNTTDTADTTVAPDGTTTADTITDDATNSLHVVRQGSLPVSANTTYVFSCWLKAGTGNYAYLSVYDAGTSQRYFAADFDLSTGTVRTSDAGTSGTLTSSAITEIPASSGWYRCVIIGQLAAVGTNINVAVGVSDGTTAFNTFGSISYVGTSSTIIAWGAQLEQRSAVSSYTPTTTQPITNYIPVLQTAASGVARFDHNPTTGESLGLLVEEQRTNICLQSEDLDTTWSETRATLALNNRVSPAGTLTADTLIASTDNDTHFTTQTFTGTAASYTFSVYAKASGLNHVALRLYNGSSQVGLAYYNLSTGATGTVTAGTASIQSVGNGFYRCILTATLAASASCTAEIYLADADNSNSFAGDAFDGVSLWGMQVELGAFPTSYIATTSATVTRNADATSMTGTNFSSWYNAGEGAIMLDYKTSNQTTVFRIASVSNGTNSNRIEFAISSSGGVGPYLFVVANGTTQISASSGTYTANTNYKWSAAYEINNYAWSKDGATTINDTDALVPVVNQLRIAQDGAGGSLFNGHIRKLAYYPSRLPDAQLQALTS